MNEVVVMLIIPVVVLLCVIYLIYAHFRDANRSKAFMQAQLMEEARIRRLELMRPNLMRRYEEKKADGLAELDQWCRKYGATIHQMEVFLGLASDNREVIDKLQDIEDGINAPRIWVSMGC